MTCIPATCTCHLPPATCHLPPATCHLPPARNDDQPQRQLNFVDDDLFPLQPKLAGTRFPVPQTLGLGVEFNEQLAAKQTFKYWEAPHLRRRGGSYTNW